MLFIYQMQRTLMPKLILSLDCAEREQIQKFQLAKGDGDKVHEPKGSLTF